VDPPSQRILVSLATYNERENLEPLIREIHAIVPAAHVLVVDDNSPDGTGELADHLAQADARIHVLHRAGKLGLGTAIMAGMRYAVDHDYELLAYMDADFSHHPRYLPALLDGMSSHDVMIGSRYIEGGGTVNWSLPRRLMSWGTNVLGRLLLRLPARDTSGGFRCLRVARLREVPFEQVRSRGYSFQQEFLYYCRRAGCSIGETPIVFEDRRAGASKVNLREVARSLVTLVCLPILPRPRSR
jgi:dolichol-phosphate mannosyltransferase